LAFVSDILECDGYEIGAAPFSISAFHDGTDGLTLSWVEVSNVLVDLLILTKACLGKMVISLKSFQRLNRHINHFITCCWLLREKPESGWKSFVLF